jgi:hypothetical protein
MISEEQKGCFTTFNYFRLVMIIEIVGSKDLWRIHAWPLNGNYLAWVNIRACKY